MGLLNDQFAVPPGTFVYVALSSPASASPFTPVAVPLAPWASPSNVPLQPLTDTVAVALAIDRVAVTLASW